MTYMDGPVVAFTDKLASGFPEPGGGAASALAGSLAAALTSMVANLTVGKEKYADVQDDIEGLLEKCERVRKELERLLQEDTEVYSVLSRAFKMPRQSEEEKAARAEAVQVALKEATMVPFQIAAQCLEVARLSEIACDIGNVNAVSDAGVSVLLAEAAAQSAALNVRINVASIEDQGFAEEKWSRIQDILAEARELRERVVENTYQKLG